MSTALELGKTGWKTFLGKKRYEPQISDSQKLEMDNLINLVSHAAKQLKHEFQIDKIILFGSLAHKAWYGEDSDIDLAVDGIPSDQYFKAWQKLESIISNRKIDFVDMAELAEPVKEMILSEGVEL